LGQVSFEARFTDGSSGVFVSNLVAVPEPAGAVPLALVLAAVVSRRGRLFVLGNRPVVPLCDQHDS
jgi:hypothetical protein